MFWLHETTRRALCRRTFLLGCLLPTLSVGGWIGWTRLDATRLAYETELGSQLGLQAVCSQVSFPRPGVIQYRWLILSRTEPTHEVARIPLLEIDRSGEVTVITVDSIQLDTQDLPSLWRPLWQEMGRDRPTPLRFSANEVKFK